MSIYANRTPEGLIKDTNLGRIRDTTIYVGIVKDNVDAQRMGRVAVWIPELGGSPDKESSWFIVSYASPFAGVTPSANLKPDGTTMEDGGQQSYGFWMQAPDLENHVLVCFANGDAARGFWFACIYQQNMNHMVPGIPSGLPFEDANTCEAQPPVVEYNKASDKSISEPKRAVFTPLHEGLSAQGLYSDPQRGTSTAGVRREAPSKVFGWITPRGNTIHIDDNPDNEFIRFRTRSGAQILVHETEGYIYANSKNGNSWVQISDYGVDVYSQGSVSLRSEGSMNLHSDASLNIEADGNLNLRAGGNLTLQSANHTYIAGNGNLALQVGGKLSGSAAGELHLGAGGSLRLGAGADISQSSGGENVRSASNIRDNDGGAAAPSLLTAAVEPPRELPETIGSAPCFGQSERKTIVRRMPTHEPYVGHKAGEGGGGPGNSADEFASPEDRTETTEAGNQDVVPGEPASNVPSNASELDWLTACVIDEAGNQSDEGKAAVAQVIKNRIACRFRSDGTVKGTVLARDQFSGFYHGTVNGRYKRICDDRACAERRGLAKIAEYKRNTARWNSARAICERVMAGTYSGSSSFNVLRSNRNATQYLNYAATEKLNPSRSASWRTWANRSKFACKIGDHSFYYR